MFECKRCGCRFVSQNDMNSHIKVCLKNQAERNPWKRSTKNPRYETAHKSKVPEIVTAINEGHKVIGVFKYSLFGDGMVARCRA